MFERIHVLKLCSLFVDTYGILDIFKKSYSKHVIEMKIFDQVISLIKQIFLRSRQGRSVNTFWLTKSKYFLTMNLPFITKRDVELNKFSDELIVRVGSFKKHLLLPRQVAAAKTVKARMEGQELSIRFEGDDHGKGKK